MEKIDYDASYRELCDLIEDAEFKLKMWYAQKAVFDNLRLKKGKK